MSREGATAIIVVLVVVVLGLLAWAWWRRSRRDSALHAPFGEVPAGAAVLSTHPVLYVATTRHSQPLERLAIRGLGFRSRADLTVTDGGVALDLTGQGRMFIPRDRIVDVAQATVAIDRVVERDGLVRLEWRTDDETIVDSYLRPQNSSAREVAEALTTFTTPTGTEA